MRYWEAPGFTYILNLEVEPEYRRRGIARAIMQKFKGRLCLEVRVDNEPAIALYLSEGLRVLGRIPMYYNDGSDAYYMERGDKPMGDGTGLENRRA